MIVLELLSMKIRLQGNMTKISFAGSGDPTVCSPLRRGRLPVPVTGRSKA